MVTSQNGSVGVAAVVGAAQEVGRGLRVPLRSVQRHSMKVAAPSLSQMSLQRATATSSPNHWWASSWTMRPSAGPPSVG